MGFETIGYNANYYGYCISLKHVMNFSSFFQKLTEEGEYTSSRYDVNERNNVSLVQMEYLQDDIEQSWERYVEDNASLFEGVDISNMEVKIFYQGYLSAYDPEGTGPLKLIWGHIIGEPHTKYRYSDKMVVGSTGPEIVSNGGFKCERISITMDFPENSREIFVNFLDGYKNTEITKPELDKYTKFGAYTDIGLTSVDDDDDTTKIKKFL